MIILLIILFIILSVTFDMCACKVASIADNYIEESLEVKANEEKC